MRHRIDLTLDCADAHVVAAFWKLALGYIDEPAPAPFKNRGEWLASFGVPEEDWGKGAWLCDPAGLGPRLSILPVPEVKVAKNRLHMDVRVSCGRTEDETWGRVTAMADRLTAAGGHVLETVAKHHVVMADPEGNEFCVAASSNGYRTRHRPGGWASQQYA
jgi:hypothetical protein